MRLLVTGAAGFIGSHLAERLLDLGHEVVGLDSFVPYYPRHLKEENLAGLLHRPGFRFLEIDLRTDDLAPALGEVDAVLNLAAMAGLARSWSDFQSYVGCNIAGLQRLLDAALAAGVSRLVHASTSSVYGLDAVGDETRPTHPVSPYGVTKLAAEHLIEAYRVERGLAPIVLRYFSIYGPRQRPDMAYRIFIEAMLEDRPIVVYDDGEQSRSNTYVDDCVAGTVAALGSGLCGTYNIGGGKEITLNEAIAVIADEIGTIPRIEHRPRRPGDQRRTSADVSRAARDLGYRPAVDPDRGLRAQVRWSIGRR